MPLAEPINPETDPCALASKWLISEELARRLVVMSQWAGDLGLVIISGFRTASEQRALIEQPDLFAASVDLSTHTSCPATGADLWTTPTPVRAVKQRFTQAAVFAGLRVGGGSRADSNGIFKDWNHVDLGRRAA